MYTYALFKDMFFALHPRSWLLAATRFILQTKSTHYLRVIVKRYHRQSMAGFRGKIRLFRVLSYLRFTFNAGSFVSPSTRSREEEDVRRHRRRGSGHMTERGFFTKQIKKQINKYGGKKLWMGNESWASIRSRTNTPRSAGSVYFIICDCSWKNKTCAAFFYFVAYW